MMQIKAKRWIKDKIYACHFYQDTRHEKTHWIRDVLGISYISRRNDGMTELN